jgi:hypothetical protein
MLKVNMSLSPAPVARQHICLFSSRGAATDKDAAFAAIFISTLAPQGAKARAVKGHIFGLNLSAGDKSALIAFLKTL